MNTPLKTKQVCLRDPRIVDANGRVVATIGTYLTRCKDDLEMARLFAAAPELLEALEELTLTSDLNEDFLSPHTLDALEKAQKAIAKAKGVNSEEA